MQHEGEVGNVDAAGGDVGGDEKLDPLLFKSAHHFVAFLLGEVALQDFDLKAFFEELISECDGAGLGAAKDESPFVALFCQEIDDELVFFGVLEDGVAMVDVAIDDVLVFNFEERGFGGKIVLDEVFHLVGESGREEPGAFAFWGEFKDLGELGLEAHAEHLVGFVEDEEADGGEVERFALEEVEETSGSGDYDLGGAFEGRDLAVDGVAAADHFGEDLGGVFGKAE